MENKERKIDIIQGFYYLLDHLVFILLAGLIFALVFGGYKYKEISMPINDGKVFSDIIAKNKEASNPMTGTYNYSTDREIVDGSCVVRSQICIVYDLSDVNNIDNIDYNSVLTRYQNDVTNRMFSNDTLIKITNEVNSRPYGDAVELSPDNLRYMLNWNFGAVNTASFSVTDVNKNRALDIANMINDNFLHTVPELPVVDSASIIEPPSVFYDTTNNNKGGSVIDIIKFALIGGIIGAFILSCVFAVVFLFKNCIRSSDDVNYVGLKMMSCLPIDKSKVDLECKRLAYRLSFLDDAKRILFVPVDDKGDTSKLVECISQEVSAIGKDTSVKMTADIMNCPDSIIEAEKSDAIVLTVCYGKTLIKDLITAKLMIDDMKKDVIGVVITNCKH